ncbi:aldehyde dehydrogenase family protein [Microbacterium immunditiarum]|uniref:Acyl-CoA reductase-like NAD-dependent aldehyde dehydrogenase n=1 Tax=Microbacterium immunditiarum TaxID=337480 RepID=A0A7Y9GNA2_9MICO|nr:aldehyde dehydrogenase family protein [Microbacterium immunditiarum]NYE19653.1 acyl-CoA reductase-like NAD-dependent aldehyde dehydrogenase [Microbacterium immunditiarum]
MEMTQQAAKPEFAASGLYIDGTWRASVTGRTAEVRSPYDGTLVAVVAKASAEDVSDAVGAALAAHRAGALPLHERIAILDRAAALLRQRADEFARAIALESAKPIKTAAGEVARAIDTMVFTAAEARTHQGTTVPMEAVASGAGKIGFTLRVPVGVVAAIAPFNFPLNLVVHKIAPAIAVGCATVLKPASQTPVASLLLAQLLEDAGLPAGWLNVVTGSGDEVGTALSTHPDVAYITFTGSPTVGWGIAAAAAKKKVRLELGSNAPLIIDEGADWAAAADAAAMGGYAQAGQSCVSTQRIFVHRSHVDDFTARLRERVEALVVGHPLDASVDVSAVISLPEAERISSWIDEAVAGGATMIVGGAREGAVVRPTILRDVEAAMKVQCQEVFGPVVTIVAFDDFADAVAQANASPFGLNAGVFTDDIGNALYAARTLDFGSVYINDSPTTRVDHQPYGGVKDSGNTREGPRYAMEEMTEMRLVTLRTTR